MSSASSPSGSLSELEDFFQLKKWTDLCIALTAALECGRAEDIPGLVDFFRVRVVPMLSLLPPLDFCTVVALCSRRMGYAEAIALVEGVQAEYRKSVTYARNGVQSVEYLEILKLELDMHRAEGADGVEARVYHYWNRMGGMGPRERRFFQNVSMRYFIGVNNPEVVRELAEELGHTDILVVAALKGDGVYDNMEYNLSDNETLQEIYDGVRRGDTKKIEGLKNTQAGANTPPDYSITVDTEILEKTRIAALLRLCEGTVPLEEIAQHLALDFYSVIDLVLKAMAKNLIEGEIDGVNNMLRVRQHKERHMDHEDIKRIKNKFTHWRKKIEEIRSVMN